MLLSSFHFDKLYFQSSFFFIRVPSVVAIIDSYCKSTCRIVSLFYFKFLDCLFSVFPSRRKNSCSFFNLGPVRCPKMLRRSERSTRFQFFGAMLHIYKKTDEQNFRHFDPSRLINKISRLHKSLYKEHLEKVL